MIKLGRGRFELIKQQQQQQEATSYYKRKRKQTQREELSAHEIFKGTRREPILNENVTPEATTNQSNSNQQATTKYLSEVNTKRPSSVLSWLECWCGV